MDKTYQKKESKQTSRGVGVVAEILRIAVKCTASLVSRVKEALVPLPSALPGVSDRLQDVGPRPRGQPRGEDQMPRWLLTILCANAIQRPDSPAGDGE